MDQTENSDWSHLEEVIDKLLSIENSERSELVENTYNIYKKSFDYRRICEHWYTLFSSLSNINQETK